MKKHKKNAPKTLSGQRGNQSRSQGVGHHTLAKELLVFNWIYKR